MWGDRPDIDWVRKWLDRVDRGVGAETQWKTRSVPDKEGIGRGIIDPVLGQESSHCHWSGSQSIRAPSSSWSQNRVKKAPESERGPRSELQLTSWTGFPLALWTPEAGSGSGHCCKPQSCVSCGSVQVYTNWPMTCKHYWCSSSFMGQSLHPGARDLSAWDLSAKGWGWQKSSTCCICFKSTNGLHVSNIVHCDFFDKRQKFFHHFCFSVCI